jgi:hypothetical protein
MSVQTVPILQKASAKRFSRFSAALPQLQTQHARPENCRREPLSLIYTGRLRDRVQAVAAYTADAKDPPEHPRFGRDAVDRTFCWSTNRSNGSSARPCRECAG